MFKFAVIIHNMLTDIFLKLVSQYSTDKALANDLWLEIFTKYSEPKRKYHTISHLEAILLELNPVRQIITDWETVLFAVYYHDIIYKATSSTNEEDSAKLARQRLTAIGFPTDKIEKCVQMILATKLHQLSTDDDTNFLTDADLAILGQHPYEYQRYTSGIREEYSIYPDFMYNGGRKKALQHFLEMERIFKTPYFFEKYEQQARINIEEELVELQS